MYTNWESRGNSDKPLTSCTVKAARQARTRDGELSETVKWRKEKRTFQKTESYWCWKRLKDTEREGGRKQKGGRISQTTREEEMSQRQRHWVRVVSVRWCGSACFLSATIIALFVPLCEKRGRRNGDVTRGTSACYCHYRGNSNIPFNTLYTRGALAHARRVCIASPSSELQKHRDFPLSQWEAQCTTPVDWSEQLSVLLKSLWWRPSPESAVTLEEEQVCRHWLKKGHWYRCVLHVCSAGCKTKAVIPQ